MTDPSVAPDRTADPYSAEATAATFDFAAWIDRLDARLLDGAPEHRAARVEATRLDPLLFAVLYGVHHLRGPDGCSVSFADAHLEWLSLARQWARPPTRPMEQRDALLAPRDTGKSTWWLLLLPLWAAAHGHVKFAAVFADSGPQAEMHLASFRREIDENAALRRDFPDLCAPGRRPSGVAQSDAKHMVIRKSGFVFAAKGIDASSLGMKVGERRPDLLLLDDVEPDESSYSAYQAGKRLTTVRDAILPLNIYARVVLSGTVTMPGSVTHQLVKHGKGEHSDSTRWVGEERFRVHHHLPIIRSDDGGERSMWPQKWPLAYLKSIEHTRSYKKNFLNDPMAVDSEYWAESDFTYGDFPVARAYLSVDGAVTTKAASDFTGLSVVGYAPAADGTPARCLVRFAQAVKLKGEPLRRRVMQLLESYPEVGAVLVESNQGGDLWHEALHDLPVRVITFSSSDKKEARAGRLLHLYQLIPARVVHAEPLPALEEQMVAFPRAANDDLVDSVGNAVLRFLKPAPRRRAVVRSISPR